MRLVVACHSYFPAVGGSERLIQALAEELAHRGTDVTVVTRQDPGTSRKEQLRGVTVVRLPMVRLGRFYVPRGYGRTLRSLAPDVFHLAGNRVWCADFYLPFAGRYAWPSVMAGFGFYQYEMHRRAWDRWYFENWIPSRLQHIDRYAALTAHERDQLLSWGVGASKVEVIPAAVALEEFDAPRRSAAEVRAKWGFKAPNVAVYAGGFYDNKRVDRLVRSVAATHGRWALVAIGKDLPGAPHDRASVAHLASETGAEVALRDVLPRPELLDAFSAADAVVLGSSYEGYGILLLEAMAMGRPFVAFRSGAAPELAATGSGFCVDTETEFAEALHRLEDAGTRESTGARGRAAVREYGVDRLATRFLNSYEQAAEHRRGRP